MRFRIRPRPRVLAGVLSVLGLASVLTGLGPAAVLADAPAISIGPAGVRIQIATTTLGEAIDALAQAASFRVTYEGGRPPAMLFNIDIEAPSVSQALLRLLDGQNLNYGLVMDPSERTVSALIILGIAPSRPGASSPPPGNGGGRPQPFVPARPPRNTTPPEDQEPGGVMEPPAPPEPVPSPTVPVGRPGLPPAMGPRVPFARPFGPRPITTPTPLP